MPRISYFSHLFEKDGPMVQPLKDPVFFARVFIEEGAPTWPNGFDLDPIAFMYACAMPARCGRRGWQRSG